MEIVRTRLSELIDKSIITYYQIYDKQGNGFGLMNYPKVTQYLANGIVPILTDDETKTISRAIEREQRKKLFSIEYLISEIDFNLSNISNDNQREAYLNFCFKIINKILIHSKKAYGYEQIISSEIFLIEGESIAIRGRKNPYKLDLRNGDYICKFCTQVIFKINSLQKAEEYINSQLPNKTKVTAPKSNDDFLNQITWKDLFSSSYHEHYQLFFDILKQEPYKFINEQNKWITEAHAFQYFKKLQDPSLKIIRTTYSNNNHVIHNTHVAKLFEKEFNLRPSNFTGKLPILFENNNKFNQAINEVLKRISAI